MNAYERDALMAGAATAHADAVPVPKKEARRLGKSARTIRRHNHEGPPHMRQMSLYLHGHPNPHRIIANLQAVADADLEAMSTDSLISEYRRLLVEECSVEADDRRGTLDGTSLLELAAMAERDVATNTRKAAILRILAGRRVSVEELRHG